MSVPVSKPVESFSGVEEYSGDGLELPLPDEPLDYAGQRFLESFMQATTDRTMTFTSSNPAPETQIEEAVDPSRLDPGTVQSISEAVHQADSAVDDAEQVASDLFGGEQ